MIRRGRSALTLGASEHTRIGAAVGVLAEHPSAFHRRQLQVLPHLRQLLHPPLLRLRLLPRLRRLRPPRLRLLRPLPLPRTELCPA